MLLFVIWRASSSAPTAGSWRREPPGVSGLKPALQSGLGIGAAEAQDALVPVSGHDIGWVALKSAGQGLTGSLRTLARIRAIPRPHAGSYFPVRSA